MAHGGMVDVVLTEEWEPESGEAAHPGRRGPGHGPHPSAANGSTSSRRPLHARARRRRLALLAVAAVAVAGVGAAQAEEAQDRAARLAAVPGVLAPLDGPVEELWRGRGGTEHTAVIDGDLVVATFVREQEHVLVPTDARTGVERWIAPLPDVRSTRDLACEAVGPVDSDARTHVVCRLVTATAAPVDGSRRFGASRLVVFDARTGERVDERDLSSRFSTLASLGEDLLLVEMLPDGHAGVMREDPVTGRVRWTFRTDEPLPNFGIGPVVPDAVVQHGVIVADGPVGWAFTSAGSLIGEWQPISTRLPRDVRLAVDVTALPDGRFAVTDAALHPDRARRSTVSVSDARDGFPLPGRVLQPAVDDGSAPDVLLTVPLGAGRVVAVDAVDGRVLWRADARAGSEALLLDRRLVTVSGGDVRAIDVGTGEAVWTAEDVSPSTSQLLTDGTVLLVPVLEPDTGPTLLALGLSDGRERWRAPVPEGIRRFVVNDGRLLGLAGREVVALG